MHTTQDISDIRIVKQDKNKIITPTTTPTVNQNKMSAASTIATNPASQKPFTPAATTTPAAVTTPTNSPAKPGPGAAINANTNGFNNNKPNSNQTTPTAAAGAAANATPKAPANNNNNNN